MGQEHSSSLYQLKITLVDSEPEVWRRLLVSGDWRLVDLHSVLQRAMGWQHLHDYSFQLGLGAQKRLLKPQKPLAKALSEAGDRPLYYHYDFASGWQHRIVSETLAGFTTDVELPVCIDGESACPPEGSGGIWGYDELLDRLEDPADPEYMDLIDQYGDFDPGAFDLAAANARLLNFVV
ncbi:MAG: plasmid pRiA4b ORF-3 family protein [Phormidesmis sp.]